MDHSCPSRGPLSCVTLEEFRQALESRGGEADVWLVYQADPYQEVQGGPVNLLLQRACWTRGEAYAFSQSGRQQGMWRHYYVYRVSADVDWASTEVLRSAEYETSFGRPREMPHLHILAVSVASVMDA